MLDVQVGVEVDEAGNPATADSDGAIGSEFGGVVSGTAGSGHDEVANGKSPDAQASVEVPASVRGDCAEIGPPFTVRHVLAVARNDGTVLVRRGVIGFENFDGGVGEGRLAGRAADITCDRQSATGEGS